MANYPYDPFLPGAQFDFYLTFNERMHTQSSSTTCAYLLKIGLTLQW